jgi:hypothetical protein
MSKTQNEDMCLINMCVCVRARVFNYYILNREIIIMVDAQNKAARGRRTDTIMPPAPRICSVHLPLETHTVSQSLTYTGVLGIENETYKLIP